MQTLPALKVWAPEHGPRQVFFDIVVRLLFDIDLVHQRFSGTVILNLLWMLSKSEEEQWHKKTTFFEAEWTPPEVELANAIEASVTVSKVSVGLLGNMLIGKCSQTVTGTFMEVMELQNFPFDCQEFKLIMAFPASEEVFQLHPAIDKVECARMLQDPSILPEYCFSNPILELGHTSQEELQADFSYKEVRQPAVVLRMKARRAWRGYVNKVVFTLALVSLAVVFAFVIPHEELGDRLAHTTTLFLTAVAFQ